MIVQLKGGNTRNSIRKLWKVAIYRVLEEVEEELKEKRRRRNELKNIINNDKNIEEINVMKNKSSNELSQELINKSEVISKNYSKIIQKYKVYSNKYRKYQQINILNKLKRIIKIL